VRKRPAARETRFVAAAIFVTERQTPRRRYGFRALALRPEQHDQWDASKIAKIDRCRLPIATRTTSALATTADLI